MWLRNFYNLLAWMIMGKWTSTSDFNDNNISVKDINGYFETNIFGTTSSGYFYNFYPCSNTHSSSSNSYFTQYSSGKMGSLDYGIIFGSGDTPVTYDDYKLESPITNNCSISSTSTGTPVYDANTKTWTNTIQFDLKNTGSTSVTINEVGLKNYNNILLYREVLNNPITLDPGITMVYTHTFKFTMPNII